MTAAAPFARSCTTLMLAAVVVGGGTSGAWAETYYRCADEHGAVTLTNAPMTGTCTIQATGAGSSRSATSDTNGTATPLHHAAASGNIALATAELDRRADINARDVNGRTPLFIAVSQGQIAMVRYLLSQHADPNIPNSHRETPLHHAALANSVETVTVLLGAGADINFPTNEGKTPLQWAEIIPNSATAKLLLNRGGHEGRRPSYIVDAPVNPAPYVPVGNETSIYFEHDETGNLTRMEGPGGVVTYDYNEVGLPTQMNVERK